MFFRVLILLVFFTSTMAAVSSQVTPPPVSKIQTYKKALQRPQLAKNCERLRVLSADNDFELKELAAIRRGQHCGQKVNWMGLSKTTSRSFLRPFLHKAHFDFQMSQKNYGEAYRVYDNNREHIKLDDKDFDSLAVKALKSRLSQDEKKQLRTELRSRSPRFIPKPQKQEYRKVARDFRNDRQFEKALMYYKKVINDPKQPLEDRWKAYRGARITYKLERWSRMKKYILSSKQWSEFLRPHYKKSPRLTKLHHDANIEYIRTLWTEQGQTQAKPVLSRLEKELKGRYSLQMVYWLKGRMAEERKKYQEAVQFLDLAAKERAITIRDRDRVYWSLAWNQRRIGKFADSQAALEKLKKSTELTFFSKTKYLYWQAENLESMKKDEEAEEAFTRLADLDPYGFYGALSFRKLKLPFPKPPAADFDQEDLLAFFPAKDRKFFKALIKVGEYEVSSAMVQEIKYKNSWSTSRWVRYLQLLQQAGAYKEFFIRYHSLPPKKQLAVLDDHPYLLFPQPYKSEVVESSKMTQVSPALIYSIMKQESGFDVKARSHADAFGLLQLIPPVAKKAAQRMPEVDYQDVYDLYRPEINIPLASNSLSLLFKKFNSTFILSVASYNASEHAVRGWVKTRFHGDPVTFIEDIPYEETKGYVKLVMRNYITYNRFEEKEGPFMFPEICLNGLESYKK